MKKRLDLKLRRSSFTKLVLSLVFISAVFLPLLRMFLQMDGESFLRVVNSPSFYPSIGNSLLSALLGTLVTTALALLTAFALRRTNILGKGLFEILFIMPMLIPSISSGMGLVILLGNNGILTRLLGLSSSIYGLGGIVLGSVLYTFPVAFLMLSDVIAYEDGSAYEAAKVLGIPRHRQFTAITLPYLRKPLISVIFTVFTLIITDYGIPLTVGGKFTTVSTVMYQEVVGQLDFGKGSVYGALLLIPAVIAFLVDLMNKDRGNSTFVTKPCAPSEGVVTKILAYVLCGLMCLVTLLPIASFGLLAFAADYPRDLTLTFANITKAFNLRADTYLLNSLAVAFLTAALGVCISFCSAFLAARMRSRTSRFLHLASMTTAAIPGLVLGLSYALTFKGTPIYGTLFILVLVNLVHFLASPYLMMYNSLSKINQNLEGVALTMGINRVYLIRDVFLPQCKFTLLEMFSYFFVNCMVTISAVSFLSATTNKPVSLMITQFEAQAQLEYAAVVSLMILVSNLLIKGIAHLLKKKRR